MSISEQKAEQEAEQTKIDSKWSKILEKEKKEREAGDEAAIAATRAEEDRRIEEYKRREKELNNKLYGNVKNPASVEGKSPEEKKKLKDESEIKFVWLDLLHQKYSRANYLLRKEQRDKKEKEKKDQI
jgi:hypothetical protein